MLNASVSGLWHVTFVKRSGSFPIYIGTGSSIVIIRVVGAMVKLFSIDIVVIGRIRGIAFLGVLAGVGALILGW